MIPGGCESKAACWGGFDLTGEQGWFTVIDALGLISKTHLRRVSVKNIVERGILLPDDRETDVAVRACGKRSTQSLVRRTNNLASYLTYKSISHLTSTPNYNVVSSSSPQCVS